MKANKAPKEIYLLPDDRNSNGLSICWYEAPYSTGAIEYTRTDTFIEKACDWLREHKDYVATDDNGIAGWIPERFIEDFKEYMNENS